MERLFHRKKRKRIGRGHGSGQGKTAGKGHKGQKSRSGGNIHPRREGGRMPVTRQFPKLDGFRQPNRVEYDVVNVGSFADLPAGTTVGLPLLVERGLVRRQNKKTRVKILGNGKLTVPLEVYAHRFSAQAKEKIEKSGGKCIEVEI